MVESNLAPLTDLEIKQLATDWYMKLDAHVPVEEYIPLLVEEDLEMRFPEGIVYGFDGFKDWYERVTGIFFDEVHTLKKVASTSTGNDHTEVKVIVNWQASTWEPPTDKSQRIVADANQTWVVKRSSKTQKPVISLYIVDSLDYAEGSARL